MPSAISLNYTLTEERTSRGLESERLRPSGLTNFGRATPAAERPLLAEERGDARYAASALSSAISLNYGVSSRGLEPGRLRSIKPLREREETRHAASASPSAISLNYAPPKEKPNSGLEPGRLRPSGPTNFGWATSATKRPLLARKRGDARYAASAPSSAISLNCGVSSRGREPGRLRSGEPTNFGRASAVKRPLLAEERGYARYTTSALTSALSFNEDAANKALEPKRLRSTGPSTLEGAAPATKRSFLARERGEARHATSTPMSAISRNCGAPKERSAKRTLCLWAGHAGTRAASSRMDARRRVLCGVCPDESRRKVRTIGEGPGAREAQA